MSTVKTNNVQIGQSATATNNFTWYQPASPDGTVRLGNGNAGAVTDLMMVNSAGNVVIGATSTSSKLEVSNSAATHNVFKIAQTNVSYNTDFELANSANTSSTTLISKRTDGNLWLYQSGAQDVLVLTNAVERMRITSAGEVWIAGTTDRGAYNLQCNGTGVWGAGAYVNGSDERIKDEINPIGSCLSIVNALNPVTFRYKPDFSSDQSLQPGFIAQELQEVLAGQPYLEGIVQEGPEYLSVAYQAFIPVLTKALQEANAKIDALEARLAAVEGAIA